LPNMTPIFSRNLVDENQAGAGFRNDAGSLRSACDIKSRLQTHLRVAHVARVRPWDQRGDGVHYHNVPRPSGSAFRRFRAPARRYPAARPAVVHVHAELPRIHRIERVLRVNERRLPAELLRSAITCSVMVVLPPDSGRKSRSRARAENRRRPAPRQSRDIRWGFTLTAPECPGCQAHDRTLTVVLFNLRYRCCQQFFFFVCHVTLGGGK